MANAQKHKGHRYFAKYPMNNYYVYFLLDPRKMVMQPFYIGKGSGQRMVAHLQTRKLGRNNIKNGIIRQIRSSGVEVIAIKYSDGLTEKQAFDLEKKLIARFGRRNNGTGILANLTDGGEGTSGLIYSDEQKNQRRIRILGSKNPNYNRVYTDSDRKEISDRIIASCKKGRKKPVLSEKQRLDNVERGRKNQKLNPPKRVFCIAADGFTILKEFKSTVECIKALGIAVNGNFLKFVASSGCMPRKQDGFFYRQEGAEDFVDGKISNHKILLEKRYAIKYLQ